MPRKGSSRGTSASTKTRATKPKSKPAKPRGKASNRQEATSVASEATNTPDDTALPGIASPRRSRSPSVPPDNRPNPRFVRRDNSPGAGDTPDCTRDAYSGDESNVPTLAVAHLLGGEPTYPSGYFPPDVSSGAQLFLERLESPRRLIGGCSKSSKGANERALAQAQHLFRTDMEAARCVLLAPHRMEFKKFVRLRKKPEASGGLHLVCGYPWVQPEHTSTVPEAEALFWKWVSLKGYSVQKFQELRDENTLSNILDQRDLRIQFAHLISMRPLSKEIARPKRNIGSSAHDERGYGAFAPASVPSTAKKPRVTHEAAAASTPRSTAFGQSAMSRSYGSRAFCDSGHTTAVNSNALHS
ncbi:hypothetical protein PHMEG_00011387 [Phytophthora megakarya]|uniref:Uncharacterized protein n=1 Tax=Phytophthora megakarya TaxID=4795 RepID=A0A225WCB9_9STRA|nr:hypothetical protein PHMEG_00011387 [Phytophthora megakarya]